MFGSLKRIRKGSYEDKEKNRNYILCTYVPCQQIVSNFTSFNESHPTALE